MATISSCRPSPGGPTPSRTPHAQRSEEHTSELQSHLNLVCRLLLEKKKLSHQTPTASTLLSTIGLQYPCADIQSDHGLDTCFHRYHDAGASPTDHPPHAYNTPPQQH